LKNLFYPIAIIVLFGCTQSRQKTPQHTQALAYTAPAPKGLPEEEFQYYNNLAKEYFEGSL